MHLAGAWLTEKSFAATPYTYYDAILDLHNCMPVTFMNGIITSDKILLKSKDFEGDYAPDSEINCIFRVELTTQSPQALYQTPDSSPPMDGCSP